MSSGSRVRSKMGEGELRAAIEAAREGKSPEAAKQAGKQASP